MRFFEKTAVCGLFRKEGTDALQDANENEKNNHTDVDNILVVLSLTIVDGKAAKTARADSTCHGGQTDETDGGDGGDTDKLRYCFMQIYAEDEAEGAAAHASCRFDLTGVDVGKSILHLSGKERHRAEDQRDDRTVRTDRRAGNGAREGNEEDEQNNEGNGTENVNKRIDDKEHDAVFLDATLSRYGEKNTEQNAQSKRKDA